MGFFMASVMLPYHYGICESNVLGFLCRMNVHAENMSDSVGGIARTSDRQNAECSSAEYLVFS